MNRTVNIFMLLCAYLLLFMPVAKAQSTDKAGAANTTDVLHPKTISLSLGTAGIGVEGRLGLNRHFNARLGATYLPLSYSGPLTLDGVKTQSNISASFGKVSLLGEYKPFHSSTFRLVGGVAYVFDAKPSITLTPKDDYKIGETTLHPNDLGQMDISVNWQGIAPYLGIAFFRDMPKHRFNVSMDIGTYYLSKPKSSWTGTNLLADNQSNQGQLDNNLSGYRWYPEIKLNFNYKPGK